MITVQKAYAEDFERVYPLLTQFHNPYLDKAAYQTLFVPRWRSPEDYFGYMMLDGERVVGFLGLIFSWVTVRGREVALCNMTNWIVEKAYRGRSLFMLLPVLKMKGVTLTDLTPSKEVHGLLVKAGFTPFETHYRLIFPWPAFCISRERVQIIDKADEIQPLLEPEQQKLFDDNQFAHCRHLVIRSGNQQCYLILTRMRRKKFPFIYAQIHYLSDPELFRTLIPRLRVGLCLKAKAGVLWIGERYLMERALAGSLRRPLVHPMMFQSSEVEASEVNTLYSESILLNV